VLAYSSQKLFIYLGSLLCKLTCISFSEFLFRKLLFFIKFVYIYKINTKRLYAPMTRIVICISKDVFVYRTKDNIVADVNFLLV